jgi:Fic family protein
MSGDYDVEPEKRNLQLEARAHIEVQRMIDRGEMPHPLHSIDALRWIHAEFCSRLPDELLVVKDPENGRQETVVPGGFRTHHVMVGRHIAPEPEALDALLKRFCEFYGSGTRSKVTRVISMPASHHRLVWIHPFADGNGRVSRLYSHALLRELGVGSDMWSVSRGLGREVATYKSQLAAADAPRQGDLDGRGNLSERGLRGFCTFFLERCLDQVNFMQSLLEPVELLNRMAIWTNEEIAIGRLLRGSWPLLREAVKTGEFSRSRAEELTGYKERQARSVLAALLDRGVLISDSPKGRVRLAFPTDVAERWLPKLYPAL